MESKALEALHVAAAAIRQMAGIKLATADNDNDSGEVIFTTDSGQSYILKLAEAEDDEEGSECELCEALGTIGQKCFRHAEAEVCECQNCIVCNGEKTICGKCHMCTRCHQHRAGCPGCTVTVHVTQFYT